MLKIATITGFVLKSIIEQPSTKVIEHPDIFIRESEYSYDLFDYIVELRHTADEEIVMDLDALSLEADDDF